MTLLSGIVGSSYVIPETPNLNTTMTSYTVRSNTTSGMTLTGANAGQLYIVCHNVHNVSGISNAPNTPTGFTSLSSYSQSGNMFSFRLSYKILTSNESTITLPSVSGSTGQVGVAIIVNTLSGSFSGLSVENESGYLYQNNNTVVGNLNTDVNNIFIGFGLFYPGGGGGGGTTLSTPRIFSAITSGGEAQGDYSSITLAKAYESTSSASWSWNEASATTVLSNNFVLKPTFI
jgi:hypothetical protein